MTRPMCHMHVKLDGYSKNNASDGNAKILAFRE